jgi:hypothetical protein
LDQPGWIEADGAGGFFPSGDLPRRIGLQFLPAPCRQGRQLALARTASVFLGQFSQDLGAAGREGFDRLARHTLDLECAVDGIAGRHGLIAHGSAQ